jgi:glycosyltransferase involved in cell wall biosynthesis
VLLTTGIMMRNNRWKDYATLKRAVTLAAKQFPEQEFLMLVLGEEAPPERTDRIEIRYIPYQKDPGTVASYYQAADIYVHAARADTFPTSILEAMACGAPVVATAVGGISEQVDDMRTGFLVEMGDAQGFAARMTQLLSNELMKRDMGRQAVEKARGHYNFNAQVDAYLNWYEELLKNRTEPISAEKSYALSYTG